MYCCTIEANYWQTWSIARPLCDSKATCLHRLFKFILRIIQTTVHDLIGPVEWHSLVGTASSRFFWPCDLEFGPISAKFNGEIPVPDYYGILLCMLRLYLVLTQTGGPCIPSSARHCTSIPVWLSSPCCWLAVSSSSTVGDLQPTWCAPVSSRNCRRPFIWLCWAKALEQSPWWHYIGFIAVSFQFSERNWKLTYFSNLIRTLFCSLL